MNEQEAPGPAAGLNKSHAEERARILAAIEQRCGRPFSDPILARSNVRCTLNLGHIGPCVKDGAGQTISITLDRLHEILDSG